MMDIDDMLTLEVRHPWGPRNLRVIEKAAPRPAPGQVLVRMRALSLNYRDILVVDQGGYAPAGPEELPFIPFSDACAVVEALGENVTCLTAGDRVAPLFFPNWISGGPALEKMAGALGSPGTPGVARELATFPETALVKVPAYLTDEEAATLPCAGLTAWRALFEDGNLKPGSTIVLQGTGGVSIFALQFASMSGLRTIVTSSSDAKLERAQRLGASHLINYRDTPAWSNVVREITGGRGADLIIEVGGADTLGESLKSVRVGGRIAVVGVVSNASSPGYLLSPPLVVASGVRLQGLAVGSRDMFEAMCAALEVTRIRPVVDRVLNWLEAGSALEQMAEARHFGKIVLSF